MGSVSRMSNFDQQRECENIRITLERMNFIKINYSEISLADILIAPIKHSNNVILYGDYEDVEPKFVLKLLRDNIWNLLFSHLSIKDKRDIILLLFSIKLYQKYKLQNKRKSFVK